MDSADVRHGTAISEVVAIHPVNAQAQVLQFPLAFALAKDLPRGENLFVDHAARVQRKAGVRVSYAGLVLTPDRRTRLPARRGRKSPRDLRSNPRSAAPPAEGEQVARPPIASPLAQIPAGFRRRR